MTEAFVGEAALAGPRPHPEGCVVEIEGEPFYRITNHDAMPPFLMSLVSDSDHWMFLSSTGALTAGRRDPDHALFPYYTDDRIHDGQDQTGGKTLLLITFRGRRALWEPFSHRDGDRYRLTRSLSKSVYSNKVVFEEINHDLGLSFSSAWMASDRFGFIRRATLVSLAPDPVEVEILDGIQNLIPDGLTRQFQLEFSTLADAYKENELEPSTQLGLFRLSSIPTDRPEPNEALRATTVWSEGIERARRLLCSSQLDRFRQGLGIEEETLIRGRRGAYFINARLTLPVGGRQDWSMVADVGQDAAAVATSMQILVSGANLRAQLEEDIARGTRNLVRIVAGADGLQLTADELNSWRHFSNALFNTMRGGIPDRGYSVSAEDFTSYVAKASRAVSRRQAEFFGALPRTLSHPQLLALAGECNDPDLDRLANEYLPLTFSRRHGDPSRPWNMFAIGVKDADGQRVLNYQGNWRDIFQNWEALALSFPGYVESMIFKFVDASTADGYNPYRVTRDGFDWEVLDPNSSWSSIGYWGDHQAVYLLRLLEVSARYHPDALPALLTRRVFTYADTPYRIKPYGACLEDSRATIDFNVAADQEIRRRAGAMGGDGQLLPGAEGAPYHVNLVEKLLLVTLARLFNYIPEAGLWMNTQKPEWNDANNALVGHGVSVVTLCHLRRFLSFCRGLFATAQVPAFDVSSEIADAFHQVADALEPGAGLLGGPISDRDRKALLDLLGTAGTDYRARLYAAGLSGNQTPLRVAELDAFCDVALRHVDHSIRANRRSDGLYHAYNLMELTADSIAVRRLDEMLEGQVAALSSGALCARECAALLEALRRSRLYRADQNSYLLYPDRRLPGFLEKNNLPAADVAKSKTLSDMIERGDRRIVTRDVDGVTHFNADFHSGGPLAEALDRLGLPRGESTQILTLYEAVFDHQSFTGRSGTFYKYEGLGCIYWHMISKLLLAVQEVIDRAARGGEDASVLASLRSRYADIRDGLGVHKPPDLYGAVPTDPYSHTPGFAGAQQPGMTGQVKEDLISRLGEMGVGVVAGRLEFQAHLATRAEFLAEARTFHFFDVEGQACSLDLEPGTLVFTTCQVPVVAHRRGPARIEITSRDGTRRTAEGLSLDLETSREIFERTERVRRLDVFWGFT